MTELKTLKDILKYTDDNFIEQDLKAEAIKWIKWLESLKGNGDYSDDELYIAKMQYINFCDLTEEDLRWQTNTKD